MTSALLVNEVDILVGALTVYGEARGCTQAGRTAIAHTLLNRAKARKWWGAGVKPYADHSLAAVCLKPYQYSCWNHSDPNYALLVKLQGAYREAIRDRHCRAALKALIDALDGYAADVTNGATHYLTIKLHLTEAAPVWAKRQDFIEVGAHRFFRNVA